MPQSANDTTGILGLDVHTLKDLEIFESETGDASLFDFCNFTRTRGGAVALRRRMERPWSNAGRIRATQASIRFIDAQPELFTALPSAYVSGGAEAYTQEILPALDHRNWLDFAFGAFQMWFNHDSYYFSIVRGVQAVCRLVQALRVFVAQDASVWCKGLITDISGSLSGQMQGAFAQA